MNAINDGLILEAQIYVLLKRYFGTDAEYVQVAPRARAKRADTKLTQQAAALPSAVLPPCHPASPPPGWPPASCRPAALSSLPNPSRPTPADRRTDAPTDQWTNGPP